MKRVYLFDAVSKAYVGPYDAQESPKEPGKYIAPKNALASEPNLQPNTCPVAQNGVWVNVPDYRGTTYYLPDGSAHNITEIGTEPPVQSSPTPFPPALEEQKTALLQTLNAERARRWRAGFPIDIGGVTHWIHSDEFSLTQHLGLKDKARDLLAGGGAMADNLTIAGEPIAWSTMDGAQVIITAQVAFDLVDGAGLQQALIFAASKAHAAAIDLAQDLTDYDVLSGWPAEFGE